MSVCVHNGRSNTSAAGELAEFRKITTFSRKNTIFIGHPVGLFIFFFRKSCDAMEIAVKTSSPSGRGKPNPVYLLNFHIPGIHTEKKKEKAF